MERIAVIIESKQKEVKKTNFGLLTAARQNNSEVYALVLDGQANQYQTVLAEYGVTKIVDLSANTSLESADPNTISLSIVEALKNFQINTCLGLTTTFGKDILPRVAAKLNAPLVMDVLILDVAKHQAIKSNYSGKTLAKITTQGSFHVYGIRPNAIAAVKEAKSAEVLAFKANVTADGKHIIKEIKASQSQAVDVAEAEIIIAGGRAMGSVENFKLIRDCATILNAGVGASRAAVDSGYATHDMQVGQTGKTVSPKLYVACGISGAIQHLAGMKTSKVVVAINNDPEAPILKKCDYGIVGDLFKIVPALTAALSQEKEKGQLNL